MKKAFAFMVAAVMAVSCSVSALAAVAKDSADKISVNGKLVTPQVYNIDGYNYFKLRDVAASLSGTEAGFDVKWDEASQKILLDTKADYATKTVGAAAKTGAKNATRGNGDILVDGRAVSLQAYNIDGYNYFKLRDLGKAVGFDVTWNEATKTVGINSGAKLPVIDVNGGKYGTTTGAEFGYSTGAEFGYSTKAEFGYRFGR